jgi:type IV secretion system protein VirB9
MTFLLKYGSIKMLKPVAMAALMGVFATAPVFANPVGAAANRDPRIRYIGYGENSIYRLDLNLKMVSAVQFSDGEQIESILIGDSASWEVVKLKNGHVISIKATIPSATTNMTVYTDRHVYTFELHSLGDVSPGSTLSPLRTVFVYPASRKPKVASGQPRLEQIDSSYMLSGDAEFRPAWVQDNGRQTSFFMREGAPRPAIFKVGPKHEEQLINSRTQGNRIVVDGVSDYWVMRIGDKAVCVGRSKAVHENPHNSVKKSSGGPNAG